MPLPTTDIPVYPQIEDYYQALSINRTLPLLYPGFDTFQRDEHTKMRSSMPPHRHGFFSISLVRDERAHTHVNDIQLQSFESALVVVNPEQVVSWSGPFQAGYIINFESHFLGEQFNRKDFLFLQPNFGGMIQMGDQGQRFEALFEHLIAEYSHSSIDTPLILRHYLMGLLFKIRQHLHTHQAAAGRLSQADRATVLTERFRGLLEQPGSPRQSLAFYADQLAVSPKYLSEAVKRSTGQSARELLFEVQLRQARALLSQTDQTIEQIAWQLGFNSHAHFSHFFRTHTGQSPAQYRQS